MSDTFSIDESGADLFVRVTPNASKDEILGSETRDDGTVRLRLRVTAVPDRGRANRAVIALLSKALRVPKSAFSIVRGETARDKQIRISATTDELEARLNSLCAA